MAKLLLVCDPPMKFSKAITAECKSLDLDIGYLHGANECRRAIKMYRPDFLILSPHVQPTELDRTMRWLGHSDGGVDRPRVFLTGTETPSELADRWSWPKELCLQRPIIGQQLMKLLFDATPTVGGSSRVETPGIGGA